jgi:hypothetical protein
LVVTMRQPGSGSKGSGRLLAKSWRSRIQAAWHRCLNCKTRLVLRDRQLVGVKGAGKPRISQKARDFAGTIEDEDVAYHKILLGGMWDDAGKSWARRPAGKRKNHFFTINGRCSTITILAIMSFTRRLKIRSAERHSDHSAVRLIFARADYDCRRQIPRRHQYKKLGAAIVNRFRFGLKV